jgi:hypothetical protein
VSEFSRRSNIMKERVLWEKLGFVSKVTQEDSKISE